MEDGQGRDVVAEFARNALINQLEAEVARLRKLVPNWHIEEAFDTHSVRIGYTCVVSIKDVLDIPKDVLLGNYVEKYRAGLVREVNQLERRHHEQAKRSAVDGSGSGGTGRDGDAG